jgi:quercetin dioxygenase-like cupin family protein
LTRLRKLISKGFKGGKGELDTRNYVDDKVKIMYSTLRPGATTGLHTHQGNCEIVYVISGVATFTMTGKWRLHVKVRCITARWDILIIWRT